MVNQWETRKMEKPMKQKIEDKEQHFDCFLNLIQIRSLGLSECLLKDYQTLKDFHCLNCKYQKTRC